MHIDFVEGVAGITYILDRVLCTAAANVSLITPSTCRDELKNPHCLDLVDAFSNAVVISHTRGGLACILTVTRWASNVMCAGSDQHAVCHKHALLCLAG